MAIDWHLSPYYGQPLWSRNELFRYKMRQGTTRFHAYATACVVQHGKRYTLALTWIRYHESTVTVTRRLLDRIRELGVKTRLCCWIAPSSTRRCWPCSKARKSLSCSRLWQPAWLLTAAAGLERWARYSRGPDDAILARNQ